MGKLHSPRVHPKEGNDKPLLNIHYLENHGTGYHNSELPWLHMIIIINKHM